LVPLIIGLTIPRIVASTYKIFVLSHFKPFHNDTPLILPYETIDSVYSSYKFTVAEQKIMNNWEEIHECEDERDAERLRKRKALTQESQAFTKSMASTFDDELVDLNTQDKRSFQKDYEINYVLLKLLHSKWLNKSTTQMQDLSSNPCDSLPKITPLQMKQWKTEISKQENLLKRIRHNALDNTNQMDIDAIIPETENFEEMQDTIVDSQFPIVAETQVIASTGLAQNLVKNC
jgi:hypothetical protein